QGIPAAVSQLKEAIVAADAVLLATPEYNNSLPGVLKNAIDWLSRPSSDIKRVFGGKPFATMGASAGGFGTILSQTAWLPVLRTLWRAVIFLVLANWGVPFLLDPAFSLAASRLRWPGELTAAAVALNELENFIVALVCTAIFVLYEQRRVDSYGLPVAQALGARTAEGALAGVVMAGAVAAGMWLLGGTQIRGFATTGSTLALAA